MKQLVILAGGKGTRLKDRLHDLPKPLIPIGGKPLLEHQIELGKRHGFTDILLFVCYRPDLIQSALGDGSRWGLRIRYVIERDPLGTGGAVLAGFEQLADRFIVMYGDTMVNVDLERIWQAHQASRAGVTLLLHPNNHPLDSDLVETDDCGRIIAFHNRPHPPEFIFRNLVSAGLYVLNKETLTPFRSSVRESSVGIQRGRKKHPTDKEGHILDFGKNLFPSMLARGLYLQGYNTFEFIRDIGTPQRYDHVCAQYAAGIIQLSTLASPQRAVFLDRDGTLVNEVSDQGLLSPDQLKLLPNVAKAIHLLNHAGLRAIVVTNQPVVAKGFISEGQLQTIHSKLETLLGHEHAFLDRIYWCPHHPTIGFAGERTALKIDCSCRKPKTGMVDQAVRDLNIDLGQSWLIGDTTTDIQTAKNSGLKSILVRTGYSGNDGKHSALPNFACNNLLDAVQLILTQIPT